MAISLPRSYPSLRRMLCCQYSHLEESGQQSESGYMLDTCGRGNFLIRKEKVADSKICGYVLTGPQFHTCRSRLIEALKTYIYKVSFGLSRGKNIHWFQSEEDLCTTVSIVLNSNSGTFSKVFVKILLYMYAEANHVEMSPWRFSSAATTFSKLDYLFHRCG